MTSPPTVNGAHEEFPTPPSRTAHASRLSLAAFSVCGRPERTARQELGAAPRRLTMSGEPAASGVTASRRSALLLRFKITAVAASERAFKVALQEGGAPRFVTRRSARCRRTRSVLFGLDSLAYPFAAAPRQQPDEGDREANHAHEAPDHPSAVGGRHGLVTVSIGRLGEISWSMCRLRGAIVGAKVVAQRGAPGRRNESWAQLAANGCPL